MNIVLPKYQFKIENINLLKKKTNTIIDGVFTKFIYSNEFFTMNGLYLEFPIYNMACNYENKHVTITYQPYEKENLTWLHYFANIEFQLLDYYNSIHNISKQRVDIISTKLYSGSIKKYIDNQSIINNIITIKISGIWETENEIGLAIKILHNTPL